MRSDTVLTGVRLHWQGRTGIPTGKADGPNDFLSHFTDRAIGACVKRLRRRQNVLGARLSHVSNFV